MYTTYRSEIATESMLGEFVMNMCTSLVINLDMFNQLGNSVGASPCIEFHFPDIDMDFPMSNKINSDCSQGASHTSYSGNSPYPQHDILSF